MSKHINWRVLLQDFKQDSDARKLKKGPKEVYHGTHASNFKQFSNKIADGNKGLLGRGTYFTDDKAEAKGYGPNVHTKMLDENDYHDLDQPFTGKDISELWDHISKLQSSSNPEHHTDAQHLENAIDLASEKGGKETGVYGITDHFALNSAMHPQSDALRTFHAARGKKGFRSIKGPNSETGKPVNYYSVFDADEINKDDADRNAKIEAALAAQGRKTTMPQEAHDALHSWWHTKGKTSLSPEQQQRLADIKAPKERRASFKVIKSSQELSDLAKSLKYLKEAVESDLFKAKTERKQWSPSREYSGVDHAAMKPHLDAGHSVQEAAHMSGVERTAQNHPHKIPELSPAMREKAKAAAMDWIGKVKQREATEAKPEINPEKYRAGKATEIHSSSKDVAKNYAQSLKDHKASIAHLDPQEQMASIQKFKADFHSAPAAVLAHADASKAHADIATSARDARRDELLEQRMAILGTTSGQPQTPEEPDVLDAQDLEDIHRG